MTYYELHNSMKNKLLRFLVFALALVSLTACTEYYDWEATPNEAVVQIPQEGGVYCFDDFRTWWVDNTRFEPGEIRKCYRYRLMLGSSYTDEEHGSDMSIEFVVPANHSGKVRDVELQISKAKKFHDTKLNAKGKCWWADLWESQWEEWETVWKGRQEA